jgi:hypothetical protein
MHDEQRPQAMGRSRSNNQDMANGYHKTRKRGALPEDVETGNDNFG